MRQLAVSCVVLFVAACGDVLPGDPPGDGAPPEPVSVVVLTALGDGAPDSAAKVVFQDPDGAVVLDSGVDAMGRAQAMLPRGGTVSAIRITDTPDQLTASITTTTGVSPGDALTFGQQASATITNQGGQTTMTANFSQAANANGYTFFTPCGSVRTSSTVASATLGFRDSCHGATFDLLGTTLAGDPRVPMFLFVKDVTYQSSGTFNIAALFAPMASFTIQMTNVPEPVSSINASRASMIENLPATSAGVDAVGDPPAGTISLATPFPQGVGTRSELSIRLGRQADTAIFQRHEVHTAALGTSATVDLSQLQLPWISVPAATATGATWNVVAPGDPPDGMMLTWRGQWNDGTRPVSIAWSVVGPATTAGVTLPRLPAPYAAIDPGQQTVAVTPLTGTLYLVDYDNLTGYDQFRPLAETLVVPPIGVMGAFVGMPFQRRIIVEAVAPAPAP